MQPTSVSFQNALMLALLGTLDLLAYETTPTSLSPKSWVIESSHTLTFLLAQTKLVSWPTEGLQTMPSLSRNMLTTSRG